MKRLMIVLLICLVTPSLALAKKCEFETLKDKFTKEKFTGTEPRLLFRAAKRVGALAFAKDGEEFLVYMIYNRDFSRRISINHETPLILTLENGEIVKVFPRSETRSRKIPFTPLFTGKSLRAFYSVSREDVERLSSLAILKLEISFLKKNGTLGAEEHDLKKPKRRARIMWNASCILQGTS